MVSVNIVWLSSYDQVMVSVTISVVIYRDMIMLLEYIIVAYVILISWDISELS